MEYFSYGCYYCKQIHDPLHEALEELPHVKLELKHFIVYDEFLPIHEAQVCAAEQDLGYEFHDRYFTQHYPAKSAGAAQTIASKLNLDLDTFNNCLASDRPTQVIQADMAEAYQLGVRGTPTLLMQKPGRTLEVLSARSKAGIIQALQ